MQSSEGRIFLMNCINQANIFGFGKEVIVELQVKRKIGYTFETHEIICILQILSSPDQNLQPRFIGEFIVFYNQSWLLMMSGSPVSFCFMSCSGSKTLFVDKSHSFKRNVFDLLLHQSVSTCKFYGDGVKELIFFYYFWNVKGLTLKTNSKISNHLRSFSSGIKKQLSQGFESVWGLISGIEFRIMNKLKG